MKYIVLHSVVPVRAQASEASEQLTQLLFGETCEVIDSCPRWLKIINDADKQEGWVDFKMIAPLSEDDAAKYAAANHYAIVKLPMTFAVSEANHQTFPLTAGTHLCNYENGKFDLLGSRFVIDPSAVAPKPLQLTEENFKETIRFFLNIPYLWGGKNAMGMDCSGFTSVVMSIFGKQLPRNASEQVLCGEHRTFLEESVCGDLVFFDHHTQDPEKKHISHVGILIDQHTIIHCSGRVKIENIDSNGIISPLTGEYTHDLRAIRHL